MKLLTPTEIKSNKETQLIRDIARTNDVRDALLESEKELNDAETRFEAKMAKQRVIWAKEQEDHTRIITDLQNEIKVLESKRAELMSPIDEEMKKAHDMFVYAEAALKDAHEAKAAIDNLRMKNERDAETLQDRIDDLSTRESDLLLREQKVQVREESNKSERASIIKLSEELLINLKNL